MTNNEALDRLKALTQIIEVEHRQMESDLFTMRLELQIIHKALTRNKEARNEKR